MAFSGWCMRSLPTNHSQWYRKNCQNSLANEISICESCRWIGRSSNVQFFFLPTSFLSTLERCRIVMLSRRRRYKFYASKMMLKCRRLIPSTSTWFMCSCGRPIWCHQSTLPASHTHTVVEGIVQWALLLRVINVTMLSLLARMRLFSRSRLNKQFPILSILIMIIIPRKMIFWSHWSHRNETRHLSIRFLVLKQRRINENASITSNASHMSE